jgi:Na+/proline symporter
VDRDASEKQKLIIGRLSMIAMMGLAALLSFVLEEAKFAFDLIIQIGAGSGLLFILRWFWYRINPWSEITAMGVSFTMAVLFFINSSELLGFQNQLLGTLQSWEMICLNVLITSIAWLVITFITDKSDQKTLDNFQAAIYGKESKFHNFQYKTLGFLLGVIGVYSLLFATGKILYGEIEIGFVLLAVFLVCTGSILGLRKKLF